MIVPQGVQLSDHHQEVIAQQLSIKIGIFAIA